MLATTDSLIFDLDGTLWDTCDACAVGWNNVLRRNAIAFREITAGDIRGVAGRSHEECIRTVFGGLGEGQLRVLIEETQEEDNRIIARLGGELFPGVAEGLGRLAARYPLYLVSNCQDGYIETFFGTTGLGRLFKDHECWGRTGRPKAENLRAVVERNRLRAPVYIGDTAGDEAAARAAGMPFVHAAWGFGLCEAPDARAEGFGELERLLAGT